MKKQSKPKASPPQSDLLPPSPKLQTLLSSITFMLTQLNAWRKSQHRSDITTEPLLLYLDWLSLKSAPPPPEEDGATSQATIMLGIDLHCDLDLVWEVRFRVEAKDQLASISSEERTRAVERILQLAAGDIHIGVTCEGVCHAPVIALKAEVNKGLSVSLLLVSSEDLCEIPAGTVYVVDVSGKEDSALLRKFVRARCGEPSREEEFNEVLFYQQLKELPNSVFGPKDSAEVYDEVQHLSNSRKSNSEIFSYLGSERSCREFINILKRMTTFKLQLSDEEASIISHPGNVLAIGRSGTGKTTCSLLRLFSCQMLYLFISHRKRSQLVKTQRMDAEEIQAACDLHQIFVSPSEALTIGVKSQYEYYKCLLDAELKIRAAKKANLPIPQIPNPLPQSLNVLQNQQTRSFSLMQDSDFPAFFTFHEMILAIDASMQHPFFARNEDSSLISVESSAARHLQVQGAYFVHEPAGTVESFEVDFKYFDVNFWSSHRHESVKFDSTQLWYEISAVIKGSATSHRFTDRHLPKDLYLTQGNKDTLLTLEEKIVVWEIYQDYERWKTQISAYDLQDVVNNILCEISTNGYTGVPIHSIKIDEVQDLTPAMLLAFMQIAEFEVFLSGDTAQTISKGTGFRFRDIRSICHYHESLRRNFPVQKQLLKNYRSHNQILKFANHLVATIQALFPTQVDTLKPETSEKKGPKPVLLHCSNSESLTPILYRNGNTPKFVVIVRDAESKAKVPSCFKKSVVLTAYEAKGLEFSAVFIYNFLSTSDVDEADWKIIYDLFAFQKLHSHAEMNKKAAADALAVSSLSKHFGLCSDLKMLYVAITRARERIIMLETDANKARFFVEVWKSLSLVDITQSPSQAEQLLAAQCDVEVEDELASFKAQGNMFMNRRIFREAAKCYKAAGETRLEKIAEANASADEGSEILNNCRSQISVSLNDSSRRRQELKMAQGYQLLRDAAEQFAEMHLNKESGQCYFSCKMYQEAMSEFAKAKAWRECSESYLQLNQFVPAAKAYEKVGDYRRMIACYEKGEKLEDALESICRFKREIGADLDDYLFYYFGKYCSKLEAGLKARSARSDTGNSFSSISVSEIARHEGQSEFSHELSIIESQSEFNHELSIIESQSQSSSAIPSPQQSFSLIEADESSSYSILSDSPSHPDLQSFSLLSSEAREYIQSTEFNDAQSASHTSDSYTLISESSDQSSSYSLINDSDSGYSSSHRSAIDAAVTPSSSVSRSYTIGQLATDLIGVQLHWAISLLINEYEHLLLTSKSTSNIHELLQAERIMEREQICVFEMLEFANQTALQLKLASEFQSSRMYKRFQINLAYSAAKALPIDPTDFNEKSFLVKKKKAAEAAEKHVHGSFTSDVLLSIKPTERDIMQFRQSILVFGYLDLLLSTYKESERPRIRWMLGLIHSIEIDYGHRELQLLFQTIMEINEIGFERINAEVFDSARLKGFPCNNLLWLNRHEFAWEPSRLKKLIHKQYFLISEFAEKRLDKGSVSALADAASSFVELLLPVSGPKLEQDSYPIAFEGAHPIAFKVTDPIAFEVFENLLRTSEIVFELLSRNEGLVLKAEGTQFEVFIKFLLAPLGICRIQSSPLTAILPLQTHFVVSSKIQFFPRLLKALKGKGKLINYDLQCTYFLVDASTVIEVLKQELELALCGILKHRHAKLQKIMEREFKTDNDQLRYLILAGYHTRRGFIKSDLLTCCYADMLGEIMYFFAIRSALHPSSRNLSEELLNPDVELTNLHKRLAALTGKLYNENEDPGFVAFMKRKNSTEIEAAEKELKHLLNTEINDFAYRVLEYEFCINKYGSWLTYNYAVTNIAKIATHAYITLKMSKGYDVPQFFRYSKLLHVCDIEIERFYNGEIRINKPDFGLDYKMKVPKRELRFPSKLLEREDCSEVVGWCMRVEEYLSEAQSKVEQNEQIIDDSYTSSPNAQLRVRGKRDKDRELQLRKKAEQIRVDQYTEEATLNERMKLLILAFLYRLLQNFGEIKLYRLFVDELRELIDNDNLTATFSQFPLSDKPIDMDVLHSVARRVTAVATEASRREAKACYDKLLNLMKICLYNSIKIYQFEDFIDNIFKLKSLKKRVTGSHSKLAFEEIFYFCHESEITRKNIDDEYEQYRKDWVIKKVRKKNERYIVYNLITVTVTRSPRNFTYFSLEDKVPALILSREEKAQKSKAVVVDFEEKRVDEEFGKITLQFFTALRYECENHRDVQYLFSLYFESASAIIKFRWIDGEKEECRKKIEEVGRELELWRGATNRVSKWNGIVQLLPGKID